MLPVLFTQSADPCPCVSEGILVSRASSSLALRKIAEHRKRNVRRTVGQIKILKLIKDDTVLFLSVQEGGDRNQNARTLHFLARDKRGQNFLTSARKKSFQPYFGKAPDGNCRRQNEKNRPRSRLGSKRDHREQCRRHQTQKRKIRRCARVFLRKHLSDVGIPLVCHRDDPTCAQDRVHTHFPCVCREPTVI